MMDQSDSANDHPAVRRFITVRAVHSNEEMDLEMPADRPVADLMPDLLRALGWPVPEGEQVHAYELRTEAGEKVQDAQTLNAAGVENADVLWIGVSEAAGEPPEARLEAEQPPAGIEQREAAATIPASARDRVSSLTPPIPAHLRIEAPSLVSDRGFVFELGSPPLLVGRQSRSTKPEIDLTDLDPELASSRRHARILLQREKYVLEALPTTNGTYLNGREVKPGEVRPLQSGDRVLFGIDGVELVFVLGGESIPASFFTGR